MTNITEQFQDFCDYEISHISFAIEAEKMGMQMANQCAKTLSKRPDVSKPNLLDDIVEGVTENDTDSSNCNFLPLDRTYLEKFIKYDGIEIENPDIIKVLIGMLYDYIHKIYPYMDKLKVIFSKMNLARDAVPEYRNMKEIDKDNVMKFLSSLINTKNGFNGVRCSIEDDEEELLRLMNDLYDNIFDLPSIIYSLKSEGIEVDEDEKKLSVFINYAYHAFNPVKALIKIEQNL